MGVAEEHTDLAQLVLGDVFVRVEPQKSAQLVEGAHVGRVRGTGALALAAKVDDGD